ncbi:MAG: DUF4412 domain-containing protein [Terriglobia bacterium]
MKRIILYAAAVAVALGLCVSARAQDNGPFHITEFSATMVMSVPGHNATNTMKIYRSGDKMRSELSQMGTQAYSLSLLSEHIGYFVMRPGMCIETHQSNPNHPNPFGMTGKVQRTELGTDTVDGHPTKIEQITIESGTGKTVSMKTWTATDLHGFPLRIEMPMAQGTARMEFKDVSLSSPPASLFDPPSNCRQMPVMPGGPH